MTDINPTPSWAAVRQLEIGEFALGGANGNMNDQAKALAARSEFLKQRATYQYNTLTEANADIANIAVNQNVNVVDSGLYYKEIAGATSLIKSPYDPLVQANTNTEQQMIRALFSRYGTAKNLLTKVSDTGSNNGTVQEQALLNWVGSPINLNGIFTAIRLTVVGAAYPSISTDASVFAGALRVQGFVGATLSLNQNLVRLGNTDIWYYRNTTLNTSGITELKVYATPAVGVDLTIDNAVIQNDSGFGFPEIEARNAAILNAVTADYESILLSQYREGADRNLLGTSISGTSNSDLQLNTVINQTLTKYSAACILECDGPYPSISSATSLKLKAEVFRGTNVLSGSAYMKRIGNSKVWYVSDIAAGAGPHTSVKITSAVPAGSTYVTVRQAVFVDGGYASPLFLLLDKLASDVTAVATASAITAANNTVNAALSGANLGWPTTAFDAIGRAATRRVDVVGIGDSNHFMDGYGFDGALRKALSVRFGSYATPPLESTLFGVQVGGTDAQEQHRLAVLRYMRVPEGDVVAANVQTGISFGALTKYPLDTTSSLRCHFAYSTFDSGSGSFKAGVRLNVSPYSTIKMADTINTNTGIESYVQTYFDVNSDANRADKSLELKWSLAGQLPITGNFLGYFLRVEDTAKTSGICFSSLFGEGGQSLWDMCTRLKDYSTQQLTNYFTEIRRLQLAKSQKPIVVIYINSGLNDRNETSVPSQGWRASAVADSPTAYLDNLETLAKRISDVWQHNGWDERELFFWVNPSHPVSTPDDSELISYRKAAYSFAGSRSRVSVVDFENITNSTEMLANGWYKNSGADTNHLTTAGYDTLSSRLVGLIP